MHDPYELGAQLGEGELHIDLHLLRAITGDWMRVEICPKATPSFL